MIYRNDVIDTHFPSQKDLKYRSVRDPITDKHDKEKGIKHT